MSAKNTKIESGNDFPLGAHWDGSGINFALFSAHAERVELCLYDRSGRREIARYTLPENTNQVWHGYIPDAKPGTLYGYRVYGPYDPGSGHRFNANKLLLDPYARLYHGNIRWSDVINGYKSNSKDKDLSFCKRNSAFSMPKCVVTDNTYHWGDDQPPAIPWSDTIIYESHVRGATQLHPAVPKLIRGTYAGLGEPVVIEHLKALGITTVELQPVQAFVDDRFLVEKGLKNYWGYSTIGFFATHQKYSNNLGIVDFKTMVRQFHDAGIEVVLDVVYNHTAEGNHLGPHLSWRGIDNASYYSLNPQDKRYYINDTGCGNTLNANHPRVLQMIMDSLRYWVKDMHVDGFRFDLATTLGRGSYGFDPRAGLFNAILQDPIMSGIKLIAEPWDLGPGGYQLGGFPLGWTEWNDRYRDTLRKYWLGEPGLLPELAKNLHGSSDLFEHHDRKPWASINFITSHDGFCLRDLVSYKHKHNHENGEDNRDGHHANFSSNFGVEGESDDPNITSLRWQQMRNMLATLLLSQGTPMLFSGDEIGHSKKGNNNAYCQDNTINWLDWANISQKGRELTYFIGRLTKIRKHYPLLHRSNFVHGTKIAETSERLDIQWYGQSGEPMHEAQWKESTERSLGVLLSDRIKSINSGNMIGQSLLIILHAAEFDQNFILPDTSKSCSWKFLISTADPLKEEGSEIKNAGDNVLMVSRSVEVWVSEYDLEVH